MESGVNGVNGTTAVNPVAMELGIGAELVHHPYMAVVTVLEMPQKRAHATLIIVPVSYSNYMILKTCVNNKFS